jgi:hypothetical protein
MKREIISFFIGAIVGILILNFVKYGSFSESKAIKELQLQNDSLLNANIKLDSLENTYLIELNKASDEILQLEFQDDELKTKVKNMNKEITIIKYKYEKASNYANAFGSDELKKYFSELK